MSSRPGAYGIARVPADGGESPNRFAPEITAEVRVHWPPKASKQQILEAVSQAVDQAAAEVERNTVRVSTDDTEQKGSPR